MVDSLLRPLRPPAQSQRLPRQEGDGEQGRRVGAPGRAAGRGPGRSHGRPRAQAPGGTRRGLPPLPDRQREYAGPCQQDAGPTAGLSRRLPIREDWRGATVHRPIVPGRSSRARQEHCHGKLLPCGRQRLHALALAGQADGCRSPGRFEQAGERRNRRAPRPPRAVCRGMRFIFRDSPHQQPHLSLPVRAGSIRIVSDCRWDGVACR